MNVETETQILHPSLLREIIILSSNLLYHANIVTGVQRLHTLCQDKINQHHLLLDSRRKSPKFLVHAAVEAQISTVTRVANTEIHNPTELLEPTKGYHGT